MVASLKNRIKCFPYTLHQRNLKMQKSPVILDLCSRKTQVGKSHHVIIATPSFPKRSVFKMFYERIETKSRRFQIAPV